MGRYTGPKNRLSRREGIDLGLKTVGSNAHASLLKRLNVPPGQHGAKGKRKTSDYGLQLREKQKVKHMYGVMERQFRNVFEMSRKTKGNTADTILEFLERRLDNVAYRLNFAPTRTAARQFVGHGHILVNGKKVSIPSYYVKAEDVVTIKTKSLEMPLIKKQLEDKTYVPPTWLDKKGPVGKVVRMPIREDIKDDINMQLIVEHYSR